MCGLPGVRIQDVTECLPRLIKPSDRYPFRLLHMGINDTAKNDLERDTEDYVALGRMKKEFEAQVVFSSILSVEGKGPDFDCPATGLSDWLCALGQFLCWKTKGAVHGARVEFAYSWGLRVCTDIAVMSDFSGFSFGGGVRRVGGQY
ncbi:unnamed protein product [Natator depressus]